MSLMLNNQWVFTAQAPDVHVEISAMSSDGATTAVLDKKVDIGITV